MLIGMSALERASFAAATLALLASCSQEQREAYVIMLTAAEREALCQGADSRRQLRSMVWPRVCAGGACIAWHPCIRAYTRFGKLQHFDTTPSFPP
jgi:hypothetical protein